jgi:hypothetical protein
MSAAVESRSLEAQIADCHHAIYWSPDPMAVRLNRARLRELTARAAEMETHGFLPEPPNAVWPNPSP